MGHHLQQYQKMSDDTNSDDLELPPGFRFHPSHEEIITFYLRPKVLNGSFTAHAIGHADINSSEPWELPGIAKMGDKDWYFYCLKGLKYPSSFRVNRATKAGYWKATGKDREIYQVISRRPVLVGMRKTLVFYKGRAPTGAKTNWVMHEFRLASSGRPPCPTVSSSSSTTTTLKSSSKEEWVICRIYQKSSVDKKAPTSSIDTTTIVGDLDQRTTSFPLPMQFPTGPEEFATDPNTLHPIIDPSVSFYSTIGDNRTISPAILPMTGMGSYGVQMDTTHFRDPRANVWSILYQQIGIGPSRDGGFMRDPRITPQQTDVIDISSMMPVCLTSVATDDGTWKF